MKWQCVNIPEEKYYAVMNTTSNGHTIYIMLPSSATEAYGPAQRQAIKEILRIREVSCIDDLPTPLLRTLC